MPTVGQMLVAVLFWTMNAGIAFALGFCVGRLSKKRRVVIEAHGATGTVDE